MKQLLSETTIYEYKYNSEEERQEHIKHMESQGYECNEHDELGRYCWYAQFSRQIVTNAEID